MNETASLSPAEQGFRMPAEWEPHRATWMAWPHNRETWPENLAEAQAEFVRLVATIAQGELVCLIASGEALQEARRQLASIQNIEYVDIPTNDAWIRDYGPTFLVHRQRPELSAVAWRYNAWGEKYPPFDQDAQVAQRIADHLQIPCFRNPMVVEGGALEINQQGELLTTISCLLNQNRNPIPGSANGTVSEQDFDNFQASVSETLAKHTGAASIYWLSGAELSGDDTDGHIDQQVRFVSDDMVLVARGYADDDPQSASLAQNLAELRVNFASRSTPLQGADLRVPRPIERFGRRLPASYLNFYICNYGVIVPTFDDIYADTQALDLFQGIFPDRKVHGLPSQHLACGLGSFHCLTQQEPEI